MSMAIDRGVVSEKLYGFAGMPTCNIVTGPPRYVSTANDGCLSQDIAGANKLLDESGVVDTDGDGIREHNGVPLRITYQTSANVVREGTQALIRDWWRQIGIETELVQHDAGIFFGGDPVADKEASLRRFFADVQMYTDGSDIDSQQYLSDPLCRHIQTRDNNWALENSARSCDPEYDALFAQLEQSRIGPEREALVKQLNDTHVQNYYEIPLVERGFVSAHLNTLKGVRINGWEASCGTSPIGSVSRSWSIAGQVIGGRVVVGTGLDHPWCFPVAITASEDGEGSGFWLRRDRRGRSVAGAAHVRRLLITLDVGLARYTGM